MIALLTYCSVMIALLTYCSVIIVVFAYSMKQAQLQYNLELMLRSALRFICKYRPFAINHGLPLQPTPAFTFSKDHKPTNQHHPYHTPPSNNTQSQQHVHGPACNHGHQNTSHQEHQATNINVKLSKLSFQELIDINSQDSLRYGKMIVDQESKRFQGLLEEKKELRRSVEFYMRAQGQNRQKQKKLVENIRLYQQEALLSERRAAKQVQESKSYAVTKIAKELLQVADCIANCKKFAHQHSNPNDTYIALIIDSQNVIKKILKEYEIEEFDPINQQFNANFQQSLLQIPTPPGFKIGTVAMTMRAGYTIHGRLLRSARVGVFS